MEPLFEPQSPVSVPCIYLNRKLFLIVGMSCKDLLRNEHPSAVSLSQHTTPNTYFNAMSFDAFFSSNTWQDDFIGEKFDCFFPCNNDSVVCVASIPETRGARRSSRPPTLSVTSLVSTSTPLSVWFDDSPTRSTFVAPADDEPGLPSDAVHEYWTPENCTFPTISRFDNDRMSTFTSDSHSGIASSSSGSYGSYTVSPSEGDGGSIWSSNLKPQVLDCLDEQLLHSPVESFAAVCWSAAVTPEHSELRYSNICGCAAEEYKGGQIQECPYLTTVGFPCTRPSADGTMAQASKTPPIEVYRIDVTFFRYCH
ncbi:hypothetical protein K439DRAFT_360438 [Ramaria rubella]|nr:hypothetical protein K439DRAFT_360438 [Ramaria rubella]